MSLVLATRSGDRAATSRRAPLTPVLAYLVSSALGGMVAGGLIGTAGWCLQGALSNRGAVLAAGIVGGAGLVNELRGRIAPLPERRAQVPRRWLDWHHLSWTAAAWGAMIGAGALTLLHHAAMYTLAASILIVADPGFGAVVGAVYGLGRGVVLLWGWAVGVESLVTRPSWLRARLRAKTLGVRLVLTAAGCAALLSAIVAGWG